MHPNPVTPVSAGVNQVMELKVAPGVHATDEVGVGDPRMAHATPSGGCACILAFPRSPNAYADGASHAHPSIDTSPLPRLQNSADRAHTGNLSRPSGDMSVPLRFSMSLPC